MFDRAANAALTPLLQAGARKLVRLGVGADTVSVLGFAIGIGGAVSIAYEAYLLGLALILLSRLADGLDGAVARLTNSATDRGAFLDITLDFVFYASIPLAFAFADPINALPAAVLLAAFIGTGSSFLAYAVLAERRGLPASVAYPHKGLHYLGGLTEAGETLTCFALMCLWPQHFDLFAFGFAVLCALTTAGRIVAGARAFQGEQRR
jgi:phosphatidylglycerophosphate synthase